MILDCSSYESTHRSILDIFSTTEEMLGSVLQNINPFDHCDKSAENILYDKVCSTIGHPKENLIVVWFHATRTEDERMFTKHGILTKSKARTFIEPRLIELSEGMKKMG